MPEGLECVALTRDERSGLRARALGRLVRRPAEGIRDVVLGPGDVLFIDNYRAVRGRRPFRARHDGTDRWLGRALLARDLRKAGAARTSVLSHTVRGEHG